jgi:histidinol dehydrogenase
MSLAIRRIDTADAGAREQLAALRARLAPDGDVVSEAGRRKTIEAFGEPLTPSQVVERICRDVRQRGLAAVLEYTARLDGKQLSADELRVPAADLAAAHAAAAPEFLEAVRRIRARLRQFQGAILHSDVTIQMDRGGYLTQRYLPLRRVGVCVPGGAAAYPSTVLMTVVPAQAAGVEQIAIVAPPTSFGAFNQELLATCHELGVSEVYRIGGAQGVAALAYGVAGVQRVDKIVGPGNLFVALAKKFVFGDVGIDSIAGPSEVIVISNGTVRPEFIAADLIAQAEHAPGSSVFITWSQRQLDAVHAELEQQLATVPRGELARQSLEAFGALILVRDDQEAVALANELASEHLHLACAESERMVREIRNAGAIFMGQYTPVPLGDYAAGPSHVLPTGATARFASGLSSNDFLRSTSVAHFTRAGLEEIADDVIMMANKEGLAGHARSLELRIDKYRD